MSKPLIPFAARNVMAVAAGLVVAPTLAFATMTVGDQLGTTEADIQAALEARGYVVEEIEAERGEVDVDVVQDGVEYDIDVSAETGEIIEIELEDDDDEDDDDDD